MLSVTLCSLKLGDPIVIISCFCWPLLFRKGINELQQLTELPPLYAFPTIFEAHMMFVKSGFIQESSFCLRWAPALCHQRTCRIPPQKLFGFPRKTFLCLLHPHHPVLLSSLTASLERISPLGRGDRSEQ